ncbi:protein FAM136A-like [Dendronephthya gigantea]|uniref:protein FAM136A-like n=1 Tax=Dendronephthya gigantea TaxID=151771 RepID=UPI001069A951|nr:protein FAM136A-like [Dendronephthya gigantea]
MAASKAQSMVQSEAENMLTSLEKGKVRPMQRDAHLCAAQCCEDQISGTHNIQNCISKCFLPPQRTQEYINQEVNNFQDRLSRCAKSCQDTIQDKVSIKTTQSEAGKLQEEMNTCVDQCCDSHRELLPRMFERMSETLAQLQRAPSA